MKQGVPGFIPQRLEEAMEARDISGVSLAQLMGRSSSSSITRWLKGEQSPEPTGLAELSRALNLPSAYFLRPMPAHGPAPLFYRSMASITKGARGKAKARLRWCQDISLELQNYIDLPECNLPDLVNGRDFRILEDSEIERLATDLRRYWNLGDGPISDLHLLLENNGIVIIHDEVEAAAMDGLSSWSEVDGRGYIYVAIDKPSAVRGRFNVAHELGHLVLHRHVDSSTLVKTEEFKEIERQANLFAAAFLIPAESFDAELAALTLSGFLALKERWKISVGMMIKRVEALGLASEEYVRRLWKYYSARGWRKFEPLDDRLPFEQPRLLARSIRLLAEEGGWNLQQILAQISFAPSDIERLTSLPVGYLSASAADVMQMPRIKNNSKISGAPTGKVVRFPSRR